MRFVKRCEVLKLENEAGLDRRYLQEEHLMRVEPGDVVKVWKVTYLRKLLRYAGKQEVLQDIDRLGGGEMMRLQALTFNLD